MEASSLQDKTVMVTGANRGMGKATALALATMGASVVLVSRDKVKGEAARNEIRLQSGNDRVELFVADLAVQDSIRQLARDFTQAHDQLHVLINNAGVMLKTRTVTVDGLETTFATNYLGAFLLTKLLLPVLITSAPARIINVSSMAQAFSRLDFNNFQGEQSYSQGRAYSQSKKAINIWTYELARRLQDTGVTANVLDPGFVATKMQVDFSPFIARLLRPVMQSPERGAASAIYLASSPVVATTTSRFFNSKQQPITSAKAAYNPECKLQNSVSSF